MNINGCHVLRSSSKPLGHFTLTDLFFTFNLFRPVLSDHLYLLCRTCVNTTRTNRLSFVTVSTWKAFISITYFLGGFGINFGIPTLFMYKYFL